MASNRKQTLKVRTKKALPYKGVIAQIAEPAHMDEVERCVRPIYNEPKFNDTSKGLHLWRVGRFYDRHPDINRHEFLGDDLARRCAIVLREKHTGLVVGVAVVIKPTEKDPDLGEVSKVFLSPAYRGMGLGGWLLDAVIEGARKIGYKRLVLMTRIEFEDAVALYKKRGFVQIPNTKYPDVKNSIMMELTL
jgi:GNAT superfamily N-acetyltransferase